jgi:hypothetical protein
LGPSYSSRTLVVIDPDSEPNYFVGEDGGGSRR